MIARVHAKAKEKYYGPGDTVMMKFYEIGQAYMQAGGKFLAVSGDDGRLKYSMFSRPEAAEFLKLYQNFALIDGTHKTNVHDHRLISFSIIDSPGYTFPVGYMMAPSESVEALYVFFNSFHTVLP